MSLCDAHLFCLLSGEGSGVGITQGPVKKFEAPLSAAGGWPSIDGDTFTCSYNG